MTVPEFSDVQRAWLAEVHGVTLDVPVTLRPGMWVEHVAGFCWHVTQFESDSDGKRRLLVGWRDGREDEVPRWAKMTGWWLVEGDYVEVDPPESWVAAGCPGRIHP